MKQPLYAALEATDGCRRTADETDRHEHGGVLLVTPEHGDIVAFVKAPDSVSRTAVSVRLSGPELDIAVARALRAHPGAKLGYYHVHLEGPSSLSAGDYRQLDALQGNPSFPPCGIVALLGVKRRGVRTELKAYLARSKGVVEEMELREVADPVEARRNDEARVQVPRLRHHVLATDAGMRRLVAELEAVEGAGYAVTATSSRHGAVVRLAHPGSKGTLVLTIAPEGWERPPKVEIEQADEGAKLLLKAPLWPFIAGWSSAYTLPDLLSFLHESKVWIRKPVAVIRKAAGAA